MNHSLLAAALSITIASSCAQAADDSGSRLASGVGRWIAAQGNAALDELGKDLKHSLDQTLKPLLPADSEPDRHRDAKSKPGAPAA